MAQKSEEIMPDSDAIIRLRRDRLLSANLTGCNVNFCWMILIQKFDESSAPPLLPILLFVLMSRDGAVARALASHQCGPGSIPGLGVISGSSLLLVHVLAPRGFSPSIPVCPSPQKPTLLNSNSIWKVSPISTQN